MPKVKCECGCEIDIAPINKKGLPARYAHGHNPTSGGFKRGQQAWNVGQPSEWASRTHKGKKLTADEIARRTATRRAKNGGAYVAGGKTPTEIRDHQQWLANITEANRRRDLSGPNNPFYGKKHTAESRAKMSEALTGPKNANWAGGVATAPYGPGFTRKFKRLIRERDGHQCQSCGVLAVNNRTTLEVHHIDHDKDNNDPTNLITVCHSCNVWWSYRRDQPFTRMGRL